MVGMPLEIRRADDRFHSHGEGRTTRHSFSFGPNYDPANISFGGLVAHNDDHIDPGFGYDDHPHRDLEIVTWVLSGALTHRDDATGTTEVIIPGRVQRMSAGTGIVHSERVAPDAAPTRFIQTWVRPSSPGGVPSYASADALVRPNELTALASGVRPHALVRIGAAASLYVARLEARTETSVPLPEAQLAHVFVATGSITLDGETLHQGDAARLTDSGGLLLSGALADRGPDSDGYTDGYTDGDPDGPAEVLVWAFRESGRRG
jgi:quercetin 2,3-dioxygenase